MGTVSPQPLCFSGLLLGGLYVTIYENMMDRHVQSGKDLLVLHHNPVISKT